MKDWWNSKDFDEFWRLWNLPVHHWFLRHVLNPLTRKGVSKVVSMLIIFFISAVFHEYVVSASMGFWSYYAFAAMMLQAPVIVVQTYFRKLFSKDSQIGNFGFWISFCFIGQPACVFLYFYLYQSKMELEDR